MRRAFVTVNGARLHYLDFGGSGEPVILLAGLGNTSWIWSDFGPRLAREGFRVLALTRRAHGESEAPARGYGLDTLASDVVAFMDSLGIPRAHLVGHSLAGAELTRIAARQPERVLRLVYIDAAYDRAAQQRYNAAVPAPNLAPAMTPSDRASVDAYLAYQRRARRDLARFWGPAVERDYIASLTADPTGQVQWRHPLARYGEMIRGVSLAPPEYAEVRAPALALYATVPQLVLPPDATDEQRAQMERYRRENSAPWALESMAQFESKMRLGHVRRVAGVHHLFLDREDETLRATRDFLRGASAQPASSPADSLLSELNLASDPQALLDSARALIVADTNAALVSVDEAGRPRIRTIRAFLDPVDRARPASGATVWIMTRLSTRKVEQIRAHPMVALYFNEDGATRYASIMGEAVVHTDPEHPGAKRHYDKEFAAYFWPDFPRDFVMIEVRPHWLEYMSPGMRPASGSWRPQAVVFAR